MIAGAAIGSVSPCISTNGIAGGIPTLGRPTALGSAPASILAAAAMPASRFRRRRFLSYRSGDISSWNPFHQRAITLPGVLVDSEMRDALGRINDRNDRILGPTKGPPGAKCDKDRLRQCDLPAQRRVHGILKELVVQQAVAADRMKVRLPVNQNAAVPPGHVAVNLLKRARAAHGHAIQVPGGRVFSVGFIPIASLLEKPAQPEMRFREARLARHERAIARDRGRPIASFAFSRGQELACERVTIPARGCRRQERTVRLEACVVSWRQDQDSQGPDALGIRHHFFESAAEIGQNRVVLVGGVVRDVYQRSAGCPAAAGWRFCTCRRIRGSMRRGAKIA